MHYRADGYCIRSENAAKPAKQASSYVVSLLQQVDHVAHALDFGCGKLRYAGYLRETADKLTLVDSEVQLSRRQMIHDQRTSVREYVSENWPRTKVCNHLEFKKGKTRFGFILCANVLSAIPHVRTRKAVLRQLQSRVTANGKCLVICQYTNSYFWKQMRDDATHKFSDGFIKGNQSNASFYGLIRPLDLRKLLVECGWSIEKLWVHDQSGYAVATRQQ